MGSMRILKTLCMCCMVDVLCGPDLGKYDIRGSVCAVEIVECARGLTKKNVGARGTFA